MGVGAINALRPGTVDCPCDEAVHSVMLWSHDGAWRALSSATEAARFDLRRPLDDPSATTGGGVLDLQLQQLGGGGCCHGVVAWVEYDMDPAAALGGKHEHGDGDGSGAHAAKRAKTCAAEAFGVEEWRCSTGPTGFVGGATPATQWRQGFVCLPAPVPLDGDYSQRLKVRAALDPHAGSINIVVLS